MLCTVRLFIRLDIRVCLFFSCRLIEYILIENVNVFRSDLEDGEINQIAGQTAREKRPRLDSDISSNKSGPTRSNGRKSKSLSSSPDRVSSRISNKSDAKKRSNRSKSRQSEERRVIDRFSDDEILDNSPRQTMPTGRNRGMRRHGELPRYDVRNIILKKREKKKRKGSLSLSRSRYLNFIEFFFIDCQILFFKYCYLPW